MAKELNIAAILKEKPKGIKLYDKLHNIDVHLDDVMSSIEETIIWCNGKKDNNDYDSLFSYSKFGTDRGWLKGLQILKPSKDMQDWSKFAWKKGDVLVDDKEEHPAYLIFESFENEEYTSFKSRYVCVLGDYNRWLQFDNSTPTNQFRKVSDDAAKTFIEKIEEHYGGKLNLETLEIQKQPELKDGDVVYSPNGNGDLFPMIFIFKDTANGKIHDHAALVFKNSRTPTLIIDNRSTACESEIKYMRPATEEQKQQLFDALEKKGKRWNSDTKQIEDLPKKCEFKTFDKVLVRDADGCYWEPAFFLRMNEDNEKYPYYCKPLENEGAESYKECVPYEGNESLVFTGSPS